MFTTKDSRIVAPEVQRAIEDLAPVRDGFQPLCADRGDEELRASPLVHFALPPLAQPHELVLLQRRAHPCGKGHRSRLPWILCGKAAGPDGLIPEYFKALASPPEGLDVIVNICQIC